MISKPSFIIFIFKMMMHYSSVQPIKLKRKSTYHFLKEDFIEKSFMSCSRILLFRNPIVFDRRNWSQFVSCQDSLKLKYDFGYDKMPKPYGKIRTYLKCMIQKCILNFKIQTWRLLIGRFKHLALRVQPETAENKLRLMFKRCHIRIQKPQKVKVQRWKSTSDTEKETWKCWFEQNQ